MPNLPRDFERRLEPLREAAGLRSRGASSSSDWRLADDLFGLSSAAAIRSAADRRKSASAAASPNSGSLRPPPFYRPNAIRDTPPTPVPPHASPRCLRAGYSEVNAGLAGGAVRGNGCRNFKEMSQGKRDGHGPYRSNQGNLRAISGQ